jgi:hypothetical protein
MEIILGLVIGLIVLVVVLTFLWEYRIRQPDVLVLCESDGKIGIRTAFIYPRHFSIPIRRTTYPIQLTIDTAAAGNLGVRIKLGGSVAPSARHIQSLIRVGGWNDDSVARAAQEVQTFLEGQVREYTERFEIQALTSPGILKYLKECSPQIEEQFGLDLISLSVQALDPADLEIAEALRQQYQARLLEETERLSQQARIAAAKSRYQADEEIAHSENALEMKKTELQQALLEKEAQLARKRLQDELERSRMRLTFEKEELQVFLSSPELLMLTPQAARLAEASQSLKNARTVISLSPQDLAPGSELLELFQNLLQKTLESRKETAE